MLIISSQRELLIFAVYSKIPAIEHSVSTNKVQAWLSRDKVHASNRENAPPRAKYDPANFFNVNQKSDQRRSSFLAPAGEAHWLGAVLVELFAVATHYEENKNIDMVQHWKRSRSTSLTGLRLV